jgi:hypothetical protein
MLTSRISIWVPGTFAPNRSVDALVGLDPHHQRVLPSSSVSVAVNGRCGAGLKHERDLGDPARHPLGGAQVERDARPAAVVDVDADGGVGLGRRVGGDAVSSR